MLFRVVLLALVLAVLGFVFLPPSPLAATPVVSPDDSTWRPVANGLMEHLTCVWGSSSSDVFAVGQSGTILQHLEYTEEKVVLPLEEDREVAPPPVDQAPLSIWIWAGSASGVILLGSVLYVLRWKNVLRWKKVTAH